ncbi:MAG TPA: sigma-70 family RNA polymerase sigma factor [Ktedonobacteraceae bacterium]
MRQRLNQEIGEESSAAILFHRHAPAIFAFLCQRATSQEDAEDLLLEVFIAALEREGFSELPESEQQKWLWRVARNKTIDHYRRSTHKPELSLEDVADTLYFDEELSPEQITLRQEEYAQLRVTLEQLPGPQQEALRLRFGDNLRCAEIASVMGKREGAVRMLLSRALNLLRTIYEQK